MLKFLKKNKISLDNGFLNIISSISGIICYFNLLDNFDKKKLFINNSLYCLFVILLIINVYYFFLLKPKSIITIVLKFFILFVIFFGLCLLRYNNKISNYLEIKNHIIQNLGKYNNQLLDLKGRVVHYKPSVNSSYLVLDKLKINGSSLPSEMKTKIFIDGLMDLYQYDEIKFKNTKIKFIEIPSRGLKSKSIYGYNDILNNIFFINSKKIKPYDVSLVSRVNKSNFLDFSRIRLSIVNNVTKTRDVKKNNDDLGVILALTTGNIGFINKYTINKGIRTSGMAHIFAISGIHIIIIAGGVFSLSRFILVRFKGLAEHYNIKKISSLIAIFITFIYLELSGFSISALRSAIMFAMSLFAIMLDRNTSILRIYKTTFFILVANEPMVIFFPSFQLSFVCVLSLVTVFKNFESKIRFLKEGILVYRISYKFLTLLISSLVTTYSIIPFEIYHFNQFTLIGILSNVIAIPFAEMLILPLSFLGVIFIPLFNFINVNNFLISIAAFFSKYLCNFAIIVSKSYGSIKSDIVRGFDLFLILILIIISYSSKCSKKIIFFINGFMISYFVYLLCSK